MNEFLQFNPTLLQSSETYKSPESLAEYYANNNIEPSNPFAKSYLDLSQNNDPTYNYGIDTYSDNSNITQDTPNASIPKVLPTMKDVMNNIVIPKIRAKADEDIANASNSFSNGIVYDKMVTPQISKERAKQAIDFFRNKGLTKEQASGIVGNLEAESGLNTTTRGDNRTSYGIAQWHNQRWTNLRNFASSKGASIDDFKTQLEYLWHELNTSENEALQHLMQTKTPTEAARSFAYKFERMKQYNTRRENSANYFYNNV